MKIFKHTFESTVSQQIGTEIRFVIASARATDNELIYINLKSEVESRITDMLIKHLKNIKKQGKLDFFATKDAFVENNAEASYLINKFPKITESINYDSFFLIIKI